MEIRERPRSSPQLLRSRSSFLPSSLFSVFLPSSLCSVLVSQEEEEEEEVLFFFFLINTMTLASLGFLFQKDAAADLESFFGVFRMLFHLGYLLFLF
jgi:hypothetical protein